VRRIIVLPLLALLPSQAFGQDVRKAPPLALILLPEEFEQKIRPPLR
jgi:hypothetical protein